MESSFTGMEAKIEEVSDKLDGTLKDSIESAGNAFKRFQEILLAAISIETVRKIAEEFTKIAERGGQIIRTAEAFGITTRELQGLEAVAATAGISTDRLRMMMTRLGNQMTVTAETEAPAMLAKFQALGITLGDLQNPAFTVTDAMEKMARSGASNAEIMQMFGRNGSAMVEVVRQLADGMDVLGTAADKVGAMTKEQAESLKTYHAAVATLDLQWQNLKATWFSIISGPLSVLAGQLGQLFNQLHDGTPLVERMTETWAKWSYEIMRVIDKLSILGPLLGGASKAWKDLEESMRLAAGIGGTSGAITRGAPGPEERPAPGRGTTSGKGAEEAAKQQGELQQEMNALFLRQQSEFERQVTADLRTESAERSRLIKEGALADLDATTGELTLELDAVHAAERNKQIGPQREYAQTVALLDQKLAAQHADNAKLLTNATLTTEQIIALQNREAREETKILREEQKAHEQLNTKIKAEWAGVTNALETSMSGAIRGMLAGTESFGQAMSNIFTSVFDAIITKLIQWVVTWIENLILAAVTNKVTAAAQVTANAAIAATAAMGSVAAIPFYGWAAAPEVGAATYLEAMAYLPSAAGGWEVPRDTLAMVHKDEKVLPAGFSQGLDALIKGGGKSELHAHVHVSAIDTQSGAQFIQQNIRSIASGLSREMSKFNPALWIGR